MRHFESNYANYPMPATDRLDIAVIIVSFRSAALTIEALRSIAAERSCPTLSIRAVVVDNASGDLPAIVDAVNANGWAWVTPVESPVNGGFAAGNNLGIKRAYASGRPDFVYLLNPDAQVRPGAIEHLARFLLEHPHVGIAGSSFENPDGSEWPYAFRFPTLCSEIDAGVELGLLTRLMQRWVVARIMKPVSQQVDWICGASMMIRLAALDATAGLDENYFLYYEETDLCRRALAAGWPTWYVPESRVMHIMGQSTNVTGLSGKPKRLPAYWFESRRRYYQRAYGTGHAIVIDLLAILANMVGLAKRLLSGRGSSSIPHYIRDLISHSVIWNRNRQCSPFRSCLRNGPIYPSAPMQNRGTADRINEATDTDG